MEGLINHPAHISDKSGLSSFIPFCSFGDNPDLFNQVQMLGNFQVPVCSLFREKIVEGQVCYEADINQYKNMDNWERIFHGGLSFIVDTNDEYDAKNLLKKKTVDKMKTSKLFYAYQQTEEDNNFIIMLQTISKN